MRVTIYKWSITVNRWESSDFVCAILYYIIKMWTRFQARTISLIMHILIFSFDISWILYWSA